MLAEQLHVHLRAIQAATAPHVRSLFERRTLIDNLVFVHQIITASGSLLLDAIEAMRTVSTTSEFDRDLRAFFEDHWWEENQHADWLARDLLTAGVDVKERPLSVNAIEAAGSQYYLIKHSHPAALLGYMAALEATPLPVERVAQLEYVHGESVLRTTRHHAEHDVGHGCEVLALIDRVPDEWQAIVYENGVRTAQHVATAALTFGQGETS